MSDTEDDLPVGFTVHFVTKNDSAVQFQVAIIGEELSDIGQVSIFIDMQFICMFYARVCGHLMVTLNSMRACMQVVIAAIILVWVYVLIGFDVSCRSVVCPPHG